MDALRRIQVQAAALVLALHVQQMLEVVGVQLTVLQRSVGDHIVAEHLQVHLPAGSLQRGLHDALDDLGVGHLGGANGDHVVVALRRGNLGRQRGDGGQGQQGNQNDCEQFAKFHR